MLSAIQESTNSASTLFEIKDFSFSYGNHQVLHGLNWRLEQGKTHGLLGMNGAGKTTLFNALFFHQRHDEIITSPQIDTNISYLPSEKYFYHYMTGAEYLNIVVQGFIQDRMNKLNSLFDLPLHHYIHEYSTGMKQKLAWLGVLLQQHPFLLLDEPFNGLDVQTVELMKQIIQQLKAKGKTIVLSSHIYEPLLDLCDYIDVLGAGKMSHHFRKENFHELKDSLNSSLQLDKIGWADFI